MAEHSGSQFKAFALYANHLIQTEYEKCPSQRKPCG
jgi:hypothetical protein